MSALRLGLTALALIVACGVDARQPGVSGVPETTGVADLGAIPPGSPGAPGTSTLAEGGSAREGVPDVQERLDPAVAGAAADAGTPRDFKGVDVAAACAPGATGCASPTQVAECGADGAWAAPAACEFACIGAACGGECVPGTGECVSATLARTCSPEAVWSEPAECENACVGASCGGECTPGSSRCASPTEVEACGQDGLWGAAVACENACVGSSCTGECVPGSSECFSSRQVRSCSEEGQWLAPAACPSACIDGACGGECVPGSRRCEPSSGVPQLCGDAGAWQNEAACPFVCLGSGTCGGECVPRSRRCSPVSGVPQLCSDAGSWQNQSACPFVCVGSGSCGGECVPGARRCNPVSGTPQLCSSTGGWQNQTPCDFECTGNGECTGECESGSFRCSGSQLELCVDSQWTLEDVCLSAAHCRAAQGECFANDCPDDTDPSSTVISDPTLGCGLSWQVPGDPTDAWLEFASGLHVDTETGAAWKHPLVGGGSLNLAELTQGCANLVVEGIGGWRVPTIDETRELGAGCAPTAPGGACALSDPLCLSQSCGSCDSCLGGALSSGPAEDNLYCRPSIRICTNLHTSSLCRDCEGERRWEFGVTNGNVLTRETSVRISGSFCIRPNFPL